MKLFIDTANVEEICGHKKEVIISAKENAGKPKKK